METPATSAIVTDQTGRISAAAFAPALPFVVMNDDSAFLFQGDGERDDGQDERREGKKAEQNGYYKNNDGIH